MKGIRKKLWVCMFAAILALTSITVVFAEPSASGGGSYSTDTELGSETVDPVEASNGYIIKPLTKGKATLVKTPTSSATSFSLKSKVTYKKKSYTITTISANAFSRSKKLTSLTLPSSITTINKNAFAGLSKLKTIRLKVSKNITVKYGAFGSISTKNMTIKVNKSTTDAQLKKLKAAFKKAGFKGTVKRASK